MQTILGYNSKPCLYIREVYVFSSKASNGYLPSLGIYSNVTFSISFSVLKILCSESNIWVEYRLKRYVLIQYSILSANFIINI